MIALANKREDHGVGKRGRWSWAVLGKSGGWWGPYKTKERAMVTLARMRAYFARGGSWAAGDERPLVVGQVRRSPDGWEFTLAGSQFVTYHPDKARETILKGVKSREAGMARVNRNAAAGAEKVVRAFLEGRKAKEGSRPDYMKGARYETDGQRLIQWGSVIAQKVGPTIQITDAGWRSKTTMAMLNSILVKTAANARIFQKKHEWFLSTPGGVKPWNGRASISVEGMSVEANRSRRKRKNPLDAKETRRLLSRSVDTLRIAKKKSLKTRSWWAGRAAGIAESVGAYGAEGKRMTGHKLYSKAKAVAGWGVDFGPLENPSKKLSVLGNLRTAKEREYAKKLIRRYYESGIAAIKAGKMQRAAHAYGALAAIRRIARYELPHAKTVSSLASFRMDGLRYQVKVVKGGRAWKH